MRTLQKPTSANGEDESTYSLEDFRASLSVMPGSAEARQMTATSGHICLSASTRCGPIGSFVRMLLESSRWSSKARYLRWIVKPLYSVRLTDFDDTDCEKPLPFNESATTLNSTDMRSSRYLYQLAVSEPPTDVTECLSSGTMLLQTPTAVQTDEEPEKMRARAEKNGYKNGTKYGSLTSQVKYDPRVRDILLPTPQAQDYNTGISQEAKAAKLERYKEKGIVPSGTYMLRQMAIEGLLPTPLAVEREHPERVKALKESGATQIFSRNNGSSRPNGLMDFMQFYDMLPTPTAGVTKNAQGSADFWEKRKKKGKQMDIAMAVYDIVKDNPEAKDGDYFRLSPLFTEEMMGFPLMWTTLPFLSVDGETKASKHTETPSSLK